MSLVPDPEPIEAAARAFREKAGAVAALGGEIGKRVAALRWECRRADRFRADMREVGRHLGDDHDDLLQAASELARLAEALRAERAELDRVREDCEQRLGSVAAKPVELRPPGWERALARDLPPRWDSDWRELHAELAQLLGG